MAIQGDYTVGANALVDLIMSKLNKLNEFERDFIMGKIPAGGIQAAAGEGAKVVVDAVDAARAKRLQET